MFFHHRPKTAVLSDVNIRLIDTYTALRDTPELVEASLMRHQRNHSRDYYYQERTRRRRTLHQKAAQFLYLNRACWNGLYRENLKGEFNVPIGSKKRVIFDDDDFLGVSAALSSAEILCSDFESVIDRASEGDFLFIDPPYTTAHNCNGFIKYNQNIFQWSDQVRLKNAVERAIFRGAKGCITNADHPSIHELYEGVADYSSIERASVIAASAQKRSKSSEALYAF